ncbi:MAG: flagellar motor switch protein FliG [Chloroflexi bacterium]|nr:flagellar motor switch protein FliG [Chloroflexota bacterium]
MRGKEKAAILLIALGPEASANVLKELRENEIEALTMQVFATEQIKEDTRKSVLKDCYQLALAHGYLTNGGAQYAEEMLAKALGSEKASEIMARLLSTVRPKHFDFLKDTDPYQLVNFIQDEQPQAIALILSHLPPVEAAKILAILQPEQRAEVAMRIATMERTPPEVIEGVESVLRRRVSTILQSDYSTAGGVEHLAALLGNVDRSTERVILDHLDKNAPELATEVRKLTFTFDNLIQLDDPSIQRVLREVDAKDLAMALRGIAEELREKIFKNLSTRAAEMLREDMAVSGPARMRQVEEAQQRIVAIVRRLEESGDLVIQRGNDDVLV